MSWINPHANGFRGTTVRLHAGRLYIISPGGRGPGHVVARPDAQRTSVRLTGLQPDHQYTISVTARYTGGRSAHYVEHYAVTDPDPVRDFGVVSSGTGRALTWVSPAVGRYDGVIVRYQQGATPPRTPRQGSGLPIGLGSTSVALPALQPGKRYAFSAWSYAGRGRSLSARATTGFTAPSAAHSTLTGTVTDLAGDPLTGASVVVTSRTTFDQYTATTSDGTYDMSLPGGSYWVYVDGASATGGSSDATGYLGHLLTETLANGGATEADADLGTGGAVTARAVDANGDPVVGVSTSAQSVTPYAVPDNEEQYFERAFGIAHPGTVTGSDGTFTVTGLEPGTVWRLCDTAVTEQSAICSWHTIRVTAGQVLNAGDVAQSPQAATTHLSGTVTGTDGSPVGDVDVVISDRKLGFFGDATTADDGQYSIDWLLPGTYRVCTDIDGFPVDGASPTGYSDSCALHRVTLTRSHAATADVRLPLGAALSGVVRAPDGSPVVGAYVRAHDPATHTGYGYVATDAHGHFDLLSLPGGAYQLCVDPTGARSTGAPTGLLAGCRDHRASIGVTAGTTRYDVDVRLTRAAGAISGRILDVDGGPVQGATVAAFDPSAAAEQPLQTRSGRNGGFRFTGLRTGGFIVCTLADDDDVLFGPGIGDHCYDSTWRRARSAAKVRAGHTTRGVDITETRTSTLSVDVTDADGHPLDGVDAVLVSGCPKHVGCQGLALYGASARVFVPESRDSGRAGVARFTRVAPGRYAVCLFAYGAAPRSGPESTGYQDTCTDPGAVTVPRNGSATTSMVVQPAGEVVGRIVDRNGDPVSGVPVQVSNSAVADYQRTNPRTGAPTRYYPDDGPSSEAVTGANGQYDIRGVAPGSQTVCIAATRHHTGGCVPGGVTVTASQVTAAPDLAVTTD